MKYLVKMFKIENLGKISHFVNAEKFSVYKVINKIVNNFVKKVVKSGQFCCKKFFNSL